MAAYHPSQAPEGEGQMNLAELKRGVRCVIHLGELPTALAFVNANDLIYADFSMG